MVFESFEKLIIAQVYTTVFYCCDRVLKALQDEFEVRFH